MIYINLKLIPKRTKLFNPTHKFNVDILTTDREPETVTKPNGESN